MLLDKTRQYNKYHDGHKVTSSHDDVMTCREGDFVGGEVSHCHDQV
jgi:ribosomal protein S17